MLKDCNCEPWLDSGICLSCSAPDSWMYSAACRLADPDTCFPDDEPYVDVQFAKAKRMCEECPVVGFCLEIGLDEKWGVWGGMTPDERYKLSKSPKLPKGRLERRRFLRVHAYTS